MFAFYFDQQVKLAIATGLRRRGVDVITAFQDGRHEYADESLLIRCCELDRVLFTHDRDFQDIVPRWQAAGRDFPGVVFVAQKNIDIGWAIEYLETIAKAADPAEVRGVLTFLPKPKH